MLSCSETQTGVCHAGAQGMGASTHPTAALVRRGRGLCFASVAVFCGLGALPVYAAYAGPDVVRAGMENCVAAVETGQFADDADVVEFKDAEVTCLVKTLGVSPEFRADAATRKQTAKGQWRTSAFASRPLSSGFIQVTLNSFEVHDVGTMTPVVAVRVGQTPASCEIWPEECSQ